jgi:hypothetical protein
MKISVDIAADEHQSLIRAYYLKRNWAKRIAILAFGAMILSALGLRSMADAMANLPQFFMFFMAILMLFFCAIPYVGWYFQMKKKLDQVGDKPMKWVFTVSDSGIQLNSQEENKFLPWGKLDVMVKESFIILKPLNNEIFFLPFNVFEDGSGKKFLELVKSYRKIPVNKLPNPNPWYFIGIICLIPFIGAALGIVYVIMGLNTYKNKYIVGIGLAGLAVTGVVVFNMVKLSNISNEYEKMDPQTTSQIAPKSYLQLFGDSDKPTSVSTSNTKLRNPISELAYKDYRLVVYKIDTLRNSNTSLNNIIKESYTNTKDNFGSYRGIVDYDDILGMYVQMAVPDKPERIYLNLFGNNTHTIIKNDSVAYYSSDFKNFYIKYRPDGGEEFYGKATEHDDDNITTPLELMFLKRNRNLYFILMFANKGTLKPGMLNGLLTTSH